MKVLLSIKPEFAEKIFSGSKRYEYRRSIFKKKVDTVIVYASSPMRKVIGEFSIETIHHADLDSLWKQTQKYSGITLSYYKSYFESKDKGYAIKVFGARRYKNPLDLKKSFGILPPQSFAYID